MTWLSNAWLGVLALLLVGSQGIVYSLHQTKHLGIHTAHSQTMSDASLDQADCLLCAGLQGHAFAAIDPPALALIPEPRAFVAEYYAMSAARLILGLPSARAPPAST